MTKTYLLIDLQNHHPPPELVAAWMGADGEAWLFFGEHEIKALPHYMVLGERVSIVDIAKPGKNSLDFHLTLYLGLLAGRHEPNVRFIIVAQDGDYDPAVLHARGRGFDVERVDDLSASPPEMAHDDHTVSEDLPSTIPLAPSDLELVPPMCPAASVIKPRTKQAKSKSVSLVYAGILKDIRGCSKPGDMAALRCRIQSRIGPEPAPAMVDDVLARLKTMDVIKVVDGKLIW